MDSVNKGRQRYTWDHFYKLADQILEAGCAVHDAQVLHCDYKSKNLLFDENGDLKLADFSTAMMRAEAHRFAGQFIGTVDSIPVEAVQSPHSEVFRIGCTIYYMLVGYMPFIQSDDYGGIFHALIYSPKSPSQMRPKRNIPPLLDRFVMKAINPHPSSRFKDPHDMKRHFEKIGTLLKSLTDPIVDIKPDA